MAEEKVVKSRVKKKKWIEILAPKYFNNQLIGESYITDANNLLHRTVQVNLMNLTRDMKKQNFNISFVIDRIENNKAYTSATKYAMLPASMKRMVRRSRERIDESFKVKTKDGIVVRLKPFLVTRSNTSRSVTSTMRVKVKELIDETLATITYDTLLIDLCTSKFQKFLYDELRKIYPLRTCEIRMMVLVKEKSYAPTKKTVKKETPVKDTPKKETKTPESPKEVVEKEDTPEKPSLNIEEKKKAPIKDTKTPELPKDDSKKDDTSDKELPLNKEESKDEKKESPAKVTKAPELPKEEVKTETPKAGEKKEVTPKKESVTIEPKKE